MSRRENESKVFVAHFDILGMSSVLRKSNERAWELLCDLAVCRAEEELPLSKPLRESVAERFFSDTIVMRTSGDDSESLKAIVARSLELFRCAFRSNIPVRGGIAYGSWFERTSSDAHDLFTGDALLRAYHIGETQQMISVAICDVTRERFMTELPFSFSSGSPVIKDYSVPVTGGGHQNRAVLNWPAICQNELQSLQPLSALSAHVLANHFSEFGHYETLGNRERAKYENTVAFLRSNG